MKKFKLVWLFIVPAIVFTFNFFFVKNQDRFYMNWTDSSYAYLFNGMNLASGTMQVGHTDNPGTTVQIAAGILIKIIHVAAGKNPDLVTDVLTDPEKYLHILSFIFILSSCLLLFYLGNVVRRISGNTALAVFIQSGIIISFPSLTCMADIRSEPLLIMGGFLLTAMCFSFIHEKEITQKKMFGYSIKFAAVCAFLLITKMTAGPVLILPFFLLKKWKSWLVYIAALPVFTVLFFLPAMHRAGFMFIWIHDLFFHSGIYGQGQTNIVDPAIAKENLHHIFYDDYPFTIFFFIMSAALVILAFRKQFKISLWKENAAVRLLTGIFIFSLMLIAVVTKQFKYHYLIPVDGFITLAVYLSIRLAFPSTSRLYSILRNQKIQIAGVSLIIILCSFEDVHEYNFYKNFHDPKIETAKFMSKYKDVPRLYMTNEFYFAEIPPAMYYGSVYAGDIRTEYYKKLDKIYPNAFFFNMPNEQFHKWGSNFYLSDLVKQNKQVLISFYYTDSTLIKESLDVLRLLNHENKIIDIKHVYTNPITGEQLYEMNRVGELKEISDSESVITCDVEKTEDGSLIANNTNDHFQGMELRTDKEAHSGNYSLALSPEKQYGFAFEYAVRAGKHYEITAWRKSKDGFGAIVAVSANGNFYELGSSVTTRGENGWEQIKLKFDLPADFPESILKIFVWNENKNQTVYFDDFMLTEK